MQTLRRALDRKAVYDDQRNNQRLAILRLPDVLKRVGLKRSSVYAKIAASEFPAPISLSPGGSATGAVGWLEHEVDEWIASRVAASREAA